MPLKRRYNYRKRAYGKKKYYRRKFSRFNTYKNRSSKAQAYQIYSLNKKINRVYKNVKPETQTYFSVDPIIGAELTKTTLATLPYQYGCVPIISQQLGCFNGRYARLKSFRLWGYMDNLGDTDASHNNTIGLRLILFSLKAEKYGTTPASDVIHDLSNISNHVYSYYMNCPLAPGFSTRYRLLKDKKYILRPNQGGNVNIKIAMKYPRSLLCSTSLANTSSYYYPKNSVLCAFFFCNLSDTTQYGWNAGGFGLNLKVAYMDDNYTVSSKKDTTDNVDVNPTEDVVEK